MIQPAVIKAIFLREFRGYFTSPIGYVFITLFIVLAAFLTFVMGNEFFGANLATLHVLNRYMPYLLLFYIPAITMGTWAEEKRQGTDALLFTLPVSDLGVVLGKYLASLSIYTIALVFSLSNVVVISSLGSPDFGLMLANYTGYWLMGVALIGAGMVGSALSRNATIGFIFGAILTGAFVVVPQNLLPKVWGFDVAANIGVFGRFNDFGRGIISLSGSFFFVALAVVLLFLNVALLGLRHWAGSKQSFERTLNSVLRFACLLVAAFSMTVVVDRFDPRLDLTSERLHTLSPVSTNLIKNIASRESQSPIFIEAFVSPEVPRAFVESRLNLISVLKRFEDIGAGVINITLHDTEKFTEASRRAKEIYKIEPLVVQSNEGGRIDTVPVFLGFVVSSGTQRDVVPFLYRGLSPEYELTRAIALVTRRNDQEATQDSATGSDPSPAVDEGERRKRLIGVLDTGVRLFGSYDPRTQSESPDSPFIEEIRKLHEVKKINPSEDYPAGLDALVAFEPSALSQEDMDRLLAYVQQGRPTLIFQDPYIAADPYMAPVNQSGRNSPNLSPEEKADMPPAGDHAALFRKLGLKLDMNNLVWDRYHPFNPNETQHHVFTFCHANNASEAPQGYSGNLSPRDPISKTEQVISGLELVVHAFSGWIEQADAQEEGQQLSMVPLMATGSGSGIIDFAKAFPRNFLGGQMPAKEKDFVEDPAVIDYVLAARVSGTFKEGKSARLIVIADADMALLPDIYALRNQGLGEMSLDNITFVMNCVDWLAGDEELLELRKRRPKHRTLVSVENQKREFEREARLKREEAERNYSRQVDEAQKRLDDAVAEIDKRTDLDAQDKQTRKQERQAVEQKKLNAQREILEDEKELAVERAQENLKQQVGVIELAYKSAAIIFPPIPPLLAGLIFFLLRRSREKLSDKDRRVV